MKPNPVAAAAPAGPRATRALVLTFAVMLLAGCGSAAATGVADGASSSTASPPAAPAPAASSPATPSWPTHHRGRHDAGSRRQHVLRRRDRGRAVGARTL